MKTGRSKTLVRMNMRYRYKQFSRIKKTTALLIITVFFAIVSFAQSNTMDSLKNLLGKVQEDTNRVLLLSSLSKAYKDTKPNEGLAYGQEGLSLARKIKYFSGEANCLNSVGNNFRMLGDYSKSLEYHFKALKIFEQLNNNEGLAYTYHGISGAYEDNGDYKESLIYAHKAIKIAKKLNNIQELMLLQSNMGNSFEKLGQLDSALHYEQNAYEIMSSKTDFDNGIIMARLGNIHTQMGNYDMAEIFYNKGIPNALNISDNNSLYELLYGKAKLLQKQGYYDSSIYYAKKALSTGKIISSPGDIVESSSLLSSLYSKSHNMDSSFKYLQLYTATKDTSLTQEKFKKIQAIAFEEKHRQLEIAEEKLKAKEKRNRNIQYSIIAIGFISFLILFLLLSNSIIVNAKEIRFFGILGLLIVFEFINLLIHPFVSNATNDSPVLMLLILVAIASFLIPVHHKLEKWVIEKMVKKNKKIRLEAAKKTIAILEVDENKDV